jgi:hypothetical protein
VRGGEKKLLAKSIDAVGPLLLLGFAGPAGAVASCGPSLRRPTLFSSPWGEAPHNVGIMTRRAGLSPVLTENGELVKDFIMPMILAIFIDSRIYSCLL